MKERLAEMKKEIGIIAVLYIVSFICFKIIFYKQGFVSTLRVVSSFYWLFFIPGYCTLLYWRKKIPFTHRFVASFILGAGITGALSYYLGLIGLHVMYHVYLPIIFIVLGLYFLLKK